MPARRKRQAKPPAELPAVQPAEQPAEEVPTSSVLVPDVISPPEGEQPAAEEVPGGALVPSVMDPPPLDMSVPEVEPPPPKYRAPVPFTDDDESEDDGPTGLLKYGQPGVYNAVDDRMVITALIDNAIGGVVRPAGIRAGAGLDVIVSAGWLAVASCGDGTNAVIGSRQTHTVQITPGPASGSRADLLWCDTYPNEGRWALRVIPEADMPGRSGLPLARITVPAGANLASQCTFSGDVHSLSPKVDSNGRNNHGDAILTDLTPRYPFAQYGMRRDSMYRLTAYGVGDIGTASNVLLRFRCGGAYQEIIAQHIGLPSIGRLYTWEAEAVTTFGWRFDQGVGNTKLRVTVTRTASGAQPSSTVTAVSVAHSVPFGTSPWLWMALQMNHAGNVLGNANIICASSAFEQVAKPW